MSKKNKYAQHVLDNIRWFAKHRHDFNFSGTKEFTLEKVHIYKKTSEWEYVNTISLPSFLAAFGSKIPHSKGERIEWKTEIESEDCIQYSLKGTDAIEAFVQIDSYGVIKPTKHPRLLFNLLNAKASLNLHIKMYAEDRANGRLPKLLFDNICKEFGFLAWMIEAVENQKGQYYK